MLIGAELGRCEVFEFILITASQGNEKRIITRWTAAAGLIGRTER